MKPIKILRLNRKHLSQMTYYFTSFQDNSCSHDGQSSICRIHSMQYIPVTPQKIIKNRSNTKMYVLPHGTKSILRLCSNDIFYQERIILC